MHLLVISRQALKCVEEAKEAEVWSQSHLQNLSSLLMASNMYLSQVKISQNEKDMFMDWLGSSPFYNLSFRLTFILASQQPLSLLPSWVHIILTSRIGMYVCWLPASFKVVKWHRKISNLHPESLFKLPPKQIRHFSEKSVDTFFPFLFYWSWSLSPSNV